MGTSLRQFRPLIVALVSGGLFTVAIAAAAVHATWSSTKPAAGRPERARRVAEEEDGGDSNDCRDDDMADQVCAAAST